MSFTHNMSLGFGVHLHLCKVIHQCGILHLVLGPVVTLGMDLYILLDLQDLVHHCL